MNKSGVKSVHQGSPARVVVFIVYLVFVFVFATLITNRWDAGTYVIYGILLVSGYLLMAGLMNVIVVYDDKLMVQNYWYFWKRGLELNYHNISYVQLIKAYRTNQMVVHFQEKQPQFGFKKIINIASFDFKRLEADLQEAGLSVH